MSVSRETELLAAYAALIRKWNRAINLISPASMDDIEARHIADSVQLARISVSATGSWVDIGSGGGLPGVVMAICRPDLDVSLIESDKRKCSFLRSVARELALNNLNVLNSRIEDAPSLFADNVSARALAALPLLVSYVTKHLRDDGRAWLMKGRNWRTEVALARLEWQFDCIPHGSETDPEAAILEISGIRHG
ncbi:16S rRNA (guanine(527)-N(7))-methyltransferase RsmG [Paracoccus ravus]|uniref:16S rRNA (guanine(527)-N(7))-methyltransferase RsmG n=1 Tax=Paracoccus ravus TaxID=2447760 RepID=UPI00106E13AE|nr:16S rRNA (guanine(527)-N(7))-methyltransferase RsmG [Paracoccus ravus]